MWSPAHTYKKLRSGTSRFSVKVKNYMQILPVDNGFYFFHIPLGKCRNCIQSLLLGRLLNSSTYLPQTVHSIL